MPMTYLYLYLLVGLLISLLHPKLRTILLDVLKGVDHGSVAKLFLFLGILCFGVALWPIVLAARGYNSGAKESRIRELKNHLRSNNREIIESDGVLLTYRSSVEKQFFKAAKERGEHIPAQAMREISLHYVDLWVEANESKLGMAMPFMITAAVKSYRENGLQAILSEIQN